MRGSPRLAPSPAVLRTSASPPLRGGEARSGAARPFPASPRVRAGEGAAKPRGQGQGVADPFVSYFLSPYLARHQRARKPSFMPIFLPSA